MELRPSPHQPLDEIIRAVLPTWNVSVEQLPFFLADTFSADEVARATSRLKGDYPADSREQKALDTIRWWISGKA